MNSSYLGFAKKERAPVWPSSIFANVLTQTAVSPSIFPFNNPAICSAENSMIQI